MDTFSRPPLMAPEQHNKHYEEDNQAYMDVIVQDLLSNEQRLEEIQLIQKNQTLSRNVPVLYRRLVRERMN